MKDKKQLMEEIDELVCGCETLRRKREGRRLLHYILWAALITIIAAQFLHSC